MTHLSDRKKLIEEAAKAMANGGHNVIGWEGHSEDEQDWYRSDATIALSVFEEALDASGNQGAIVNSIIERTRTDATDDEREALVEAIRDALGVTPETIAAGHQRPGNSEDLADALIARGFGFRRSEVPEPSDEDAFAPGECTGAGDCDAPIHVHGCYRPHRADQCDAPEEYGHLPAEPSAERTMIEAIKMRAHLAAETMHFVGSDYPVKAIAYTNFLHILGEALDSTAGPQGEPSDAQVEAIRELELEIPTAYVRDDMDGPVIILSEQAAKTALAALRAAGGVR